MAARRGSDWAAAGVSSLQGWVWQVSFCLLQVQGWGRSCRLVEAVGGALDRRDARGPAEASGTRRI